MPSLEPFCRSRFLLVVRSFYYLSLAALAALISGCASVGTDYSEPEACLPDAWNQRLNEAFGLRALGSESWWSDFEDPVLDQLIEQAVAGNPSLGVAYEQTVQAWRSRQAARSALFPDVALGGDYTRSLTSENIGSGAGGQESDLYAAGATVSWELDVFGGVSRGVEAEDARIQATEEAYRDVMVSLIAEVAVNYINFRTLQARISVAEQNIQNQQDSLQLATDRFDSGLAPKQDITQAQTNLSTTLAFLPELKDAQVQALNRLAALLGTFPSEVYALLEVAQPIPRPSAGYFIGKPAEIIRSRPDIRNAERALAQQWAAVGVAEADLYPRFTLNGSFELAANGVGDLVESGSLQYGFGPAFRWNLFNAGRVRSLIEIEESQVRAAYLNYENAVFLAVEEVENAFSRLVNEQARLTALWTGEDSAEETVELVLENYRRGLSDFQNVLDAERTVFQTQDSRVVSQGRMAAAYVALYKAYGGGFPVGKAPEPRIIVLDEIGTEEVAEDEE